MILGEKHGTSYLPCTILTITKENIIQIAETYAHILTGLKRGKILDLNSAMNY